MTDAENIVQDILNIPPRTCVRAEDVASAAMHESCLRSFSLLQLAYTLLDREWPHEAIVVTLKLADLIAEREQLFREHPSAIPEASSPQ